MKRARASETVRSSTIASRMAARLVALAASYGLDGRSLAIEAGVDLAALEDPDGRVDVSTSDELLERIDALARDPSIGIRLAAVRDPSTYDAAGIALLSARTLRLGFARAFRCQAVWGDGERFTLRGDAIAFDPGTPARRANEIVTECALVEIAGAVRALAGAAPIGASIRHDASKHEAALVEALGCAVATPARASAIRFAARNLDAPIPPRVIEMLGVFAPVRTETFAASVEDVVGRAVIAGGATIVGVAERFGMSPRTLQRRLDADGTTFERIVDGARRSLATSLLSKGVAIAETGALLGYADKAAFYRAFRRWNGTTPDASRKARALGSSP